MDQRRRRIEERLSERDFAPQGRPMLRSRSIEYEMADRTRGLAVGGIGAVHLVFQRTGLARAIDERLHLLRVHQPYHESDHVANIAYNVMCGGTCLEDLELLRNDEVFLDALGAERIPDCTTAGDFCRRFSPKDIEALATAINETRLKVWAQQPQEFFEEAVIDGDGTIVETGAEKKAGIDLSYNGRWGYHPLLISLANTREPLFVVNRSANRPSHEGAAGYFDQAVQLCRRAGFQKITLRGDTDFSQTAFLDGWDGDGVRFVFGYDAHSNLVARAQSLHAIQWNEFTRPARWEVKTEPRARRENVKQPIVEARGFRNIRTEAEHVAEFSYQPTNCTRSYRIVALRKTLTVHEGQRLLVPEIMYFFFITNDRKATASAIVLEANRRCNQENLIQQLKNGAPALRTPVDGLVSNGAYMVMASLAWTLKAWLALLLPEDGRWKARRHEEKRRLLAMEFKRFLNSLIRIPAQLVSSGRRVVLRLLAWNPLLPIFCRAVDALARPLRC
jgi:hypothetical protein